MWLYCSSTFARSCSLSLSPQIKFKFKFKFLQFSISPVLDAVFSAPNIILLSTNIIVVYYSFCFFAGKLVKHYSYKLKIYINAKQCLAKSPFKFIDFSVFMLISGEIMMMRLKIFCFWLDIFSYCARAHYVRLCSYFHRHFCAKRCACFQFVELFYLPHKICL